MIQINEVQPKAVTRFGKTCERTETLNTYNLEIKKNKSVRLFGTYRNHIKGPVEFNITFKIGDSAEYDSYNFKYTGEIIAIGEKTITIEAYKGTENSRKYRLDWHTFCWRNWDFNASEIAEYNANEMYYI